MLDAAALAALPDAIEEELAARTPFTFTLDLRTDPDRGPWPPGDGTVIVMRVAESRR